MKVIYILFIGLFLIKASSASLDVGFSDGEAVVEIVQPTIPENVSAQNVNNSQYFQGYTPDTLKTWIQSAFDSVYCLLTGCTMTGPLVVPNINVSSQLHYNELRDTSLVGYWQFNNNQANDSSIYGNDGTFEGGAHAEKDVAEFDGVDDYIKRTVADFRSSDTQGTITAWIKVPSGSSGSRTIISSADEGSGSNFVTFRVRSAENNLEFLIDDPTTNTVTATTAINDNNWHHVVITSDGSSYTFYVDGIEDTIIDGTNDGKWFGDVVIRDNLMIGALERNAGAGNFFNGTIDEVKIYNRALSHEEINQIYEEENKRFGYFNYLETDNILTEELNVTGESWFKSFIHIFDNIKTYFGDADDVSMEFNGSDYIIKAEVGTPNYYLDTDGKVIVLNDLDVEKNFTGNQIIGEAWYHSHAPTELNFAVDGQFYNLTLNESDVNGFIFNDAEDYLEAQVAGKYLVNYMASGDGQNNHNYYVSVFVNGVGQDSSESHKKMTAGGDIVTMTGSGFIDLNVGDEIKLATADIGGTGTGNYYSSNLNLVRIGA